ncbi:MAG: class I SAM-dependent methyltransferase [Defluviitaleaceae bacterium]|nr:class I SAM-dependent methyltransferase [Defluviitaleaceae bacterium]
MDINYAQWGVFIDNIIKAHMPKASLVLDLGCGTGNLTTLFPHYEMIALDISTDMLMVAREKAESLGQNVLFLNQDIRSFELYGTVDACICTCDCLNYILEQDELLQTFRLVKNYLNPNGVFIFDINSTHKFENILATNTFSQTEPNSAIIWENYYNKSTKINEYNLTIFTQQKNSMYIRNGEIHYQRAYTEQEIESFAKTAGLTVTGKYDGYTKNAPKLTSERLVYIVKNIAKGK